MFTAIILMCNVDNIICWPYVNKATVSTEEICEDAIAAVMQSDQMSLLLEQGWRPENYRCVNWKEESA